MTSFPANYNLLVAQSTRLRPIVEVAEGLGLQPDDIELYGRHKAKVDLRVLERLTRPPGKLVLVTAITPTPAGEGKTTVTIGLAQGLCRVGQRAISATREPSMGPVFGLKGGAAGGGRSQVLPMEDINLHFTGDMHAVTAAHNLIVALLDNSIYQGNPYQIDVRNVPIRRVLDMNDRALRNIVLGLGGKGNGVPREGAFQITSSSEVMAVLCLSNSLAELKARLGRMVIGLQRDGSPVTASQLKAHGAATAVLRDALKPNLVQTVEGTPALIHGGPFGNIAHGASSVLATRLGLRLGDFVVTEAGFGSDLGAEKFCNIVCRESGLAPDAFVIVATVRALKMHGGRAKTDLAEPDVAAVERGLRNLERHLQHLSQYGVPRVVAINRHAQDTEAELEAVLAGCRHLGVPAAVADVYGQGGEGAVDLAQLVVTAAAQPSSFAPLYPLDRPVFEKLNTLATRVYGADGVVLEGPAIDRVRWIDKHGFGGLPICMAKTQFSLSDDATLVGAPTNFEIRVRDVDVSAGAGFLVVHTGSVLLMPGLPKVPSSETIDVTDNGDLVGLF